MRYRELPPMKNLSEKRINAIKEDTPKLVGQRIRDEREKQNITQSQLAEAVGKDRQYLYKIESGKVTPNVSTIAVLAEALGVSLSELVKF